MPAQRTQARPAPGGGIDSGIGGGIDAIIADLTERLADLSAYIDRTALEHAEYLSALRLHSLLSSRLGRLMRDRQRLQGVADDLAAAINEALDTVGAVLGVDV